MELLSFPTDTCTVLMMAWLHEVLAWRYDYCIRIFQLSKTA